MLPKVFLCTSVEAFSEVTSRSGLQKLSLGHTDEATTLSSQPLISCVAVAPLYGSLTCAKGGEGGCASSRAERGKAPATTNEGGKTRTGAQNRGGEKKKKKRLMGGERRRASVSHGRCF